MPTSPEYTTASFAYNTAVLATDSDPETANQPRRNLKMVKEIESIT
jgi:hypothetical protein